MTQIEPESISENIERQKRGNDLANQYTSELSEERAAAEKVLRDGGATVAELARYFSRLPGGRRVPRSTVQRWVPDDLDVAAARDDAVARAMARARTQKARRPEVAGLSLG